MTSLEQQYYEYDPFWNPEFSPLGEVDTQRVVDIYSLIPQGVESLLDAGCGSGIFCNYVSDKRPDLRLVGFDRSVAALKYVRIEKREGDLTALPFSDQEFDCVTCLEVLEHLTVPTYAQALHNLARVARNHIIVSVPNNQRLGEAMTECPGCRSCFDPDLHLRSFDEKAMCELFSDLGFRCKSVHRLGRYVQYRGFKAIARLRHRKPIGMASPLCPVCGEVNPNFLTASNKGSGSVLKRSGVSAGIKRAIKGRWPTVEGHRWLVAVYTRV